MLDSSTVRTSEFRFLFALNGRPDNLAGEGAEKSMMAEAKGYRIEVEILTDIYRIRGSLFVPLAGVGGYSVRLSDFLNNPDKHFLALTDVKVESLPDPKEKFETPFLAVNKRTVTMVRATEES